MKSKKKQIWIFGDYRNYFQNRVTLQLLAKARELANEINADVCALVMGYNTQEYIDEYIAHGADIVHSFDHKELDIYKVDRFVHLTSQLAHQYQPDIFLIGGTSFGHEYAPRVAKRLQTGLTADCVALSINEKKCLVQTAPAFGGNLLAEIITPNHRPQMATVRPGTFQELPHDYDRKGNVICHDYLSDAPKERIRWIKSEREPQTEQSLEKASVVICGGRGMQSKKKFKKLFDLARLIRGEVGATRPVVYSRWTSPETLVGQAGKQVSPQILFSFGISGAIQHTAAISDAKLIIAINKNPNATIMKMADVAIVSDANQVCSALIKAFKKRIRI
jgi:electron transfer flavoprotein alpha subunit